MFTKFPSYLAQIYVYKLFLMHTELIAFQNDIKIDFVLTIRPVIYFHRRHKPTLISSKRTRVQFERLFAVTLK
jgi:hypothetical protein